MLGFDGDAPAPCPRCKPGEKRRQDRFQPLDPTRISLAELAGRPC